MQPLPVWPVMFYDFDWPEHSKHVADIKRICYDLEKKNNVSGVATDAKRGLYESGFDLLNYDDPAMRAFADWVKMCMFKAASHANQRYWPKGMSVAVNVHESWCHITRDGGYHDMHIHPGSSWSAIYYVDCGDMNTAAKNGANRFYSPYNSMYTDAGTAWVSANNSIDFAAEPGMLIVFPSFVQHSAVTYRGQRDRIVIAVNAQITRTN